MKQFPYPLRFSIPVILLVFSTALGLVNLQREKAQSFQRVEEYTSSNAKFSGNQMSGMLEYLFRRGDTEQAEAAISQMQGDANLKLGVLYDENNRVLLATQFELRNRAVNETPAANNADLFPQIREAMSGRVLPSEDGQHIWAIYPVLLGSVPGELRPSKVGILWLEYDVSTLKQVALTDSLRRSLESTAGLGLLCIVAWLFFEKTLTRRAARLVAASHSLTKGELDERAGLQGSDELAQIATAFDQMAEHIQLNTEALRTSEEQFRTLISNIPGAVYRATYSETRILEFMSEAIADIAGYPATDLVENAVRDFASLMHCEDVMLVKTAIDRSLQEQQPYVIEYRILHADGSVRWVYDKGKGIFDEAGKLLWLDGVIFDISDRKRIEDDRKRAEAALKDANETLEIRVKERTAALKEKTIILEQTLDELRQTQAQLIQTEKMSGLGQLVAGIAHEINNPVSFIHGNINHVISYIQNLIDLVELYQKHYSHPFPEIQAQIDEIDLEFLLEDLPKILASVRTGTDRIRQIVLSLRNFSRLDEAEMKVVDIHEGIDSTLLILQHRLKANGSHNGIQVVKQYGELPEVECYPGQLNQVFMNLLANAIDAVESSRDAVKVPEKTGLRELENVATVETLLRSDQPIIEIVTEQVEIPAPNGLPSNRRVVIRIVDNGPGMLPEVKQRVFNPFFTTKPVGKGTGLGLSISYQIIVEKHNGSLGCTSEPGQGSEFRIEIPLNQCK